MLNYRADIGHSWSAAILQEGSGYSIEMYDVITKVLAVYTLNANTI